MQMSGNADPRELLRRHSQNPILRPQDFPKMVNAVFNPGVTVIDGRTLLLLRVEYRTGLSALVAATSEDGLTNWEIDPVRGLHPLDDSFEEHWGIEDPRITKVGDEYYVVYVGYSPAGPLVLLATTRDFVHWERKGVLMSPEDKDAALFPTTFGGRWALIHRPAPSMPGLGAHMWLSFSPDLRHWGDSRILLAARRGGWWDANKVGLGPPPLLTKDGWLVCYHGVRVTASGSIYRLGLALLTGMTLPRCWLGGTSGSSAPTRATSAAVTYPMWCSPAGGCSETTETRCTCTTAPRTQSSAWRRRAWRPSSATSRSTRGLAHPTRCARWA